MAAPGAEEAAWNRLDLPWPACSAVVAVPAQHASVQYLPHVKKRCSAVRNFLRSQAMITEERLLHSIIYKFHYQMRSHKPYQSLRQVEQCLKRFNGMNLEKSIQRLVLLGPKKQKSENIQEYLVPSQPVIEVVLVKILGGCKLSLRLLECCCTAFLFTVKHLHLEEHVLLNAVVLGLLSRLWILYRGLLESLCALYGSLFQLVQEVSKVQPRPFIKGFDFPSELNEFLGPAYSEIKKKRPQAFVTKTAATGWIHRRFKRSKTSYQAQSLVTSTLPARVRKVVTNTQAATDIGEPVLVHRMHEDFGKELRFDVKTLCRYNPALQMNTKFWLELPESKQRSSPGSPKTLRFQQLKSFVPQFQETHTFEELADSLRMVVLWCKSNKLRSEAFFLRMKLLKSRRLQHVEAHGCRLPKKLACVKATICKYLTASNSSWRPNQILRASSCAQGQMKFSRKSCHLVKRKLSNTPPILAPATQTGSMFSTKWPAYCPVPEADSGSITETVEEQLPRDAFKFAVVETNPGHLQKNATAEKDAIDDIFEAIGI